MTNHLDFDYNEQFPTLNSAPIVEAILHWQAVATSNFFEANYLCALKEYFPDYDVQPQHNLTTGIQGSDKGIVINHSNVVQGARIQKKQGIGGLDFACQFLRNGVIFSKLAPYKDWGDFQERANEFWEHFKVVGKPLEISQLSTRFISQVPIISAEDSNRYVGPNCAPLSMLGLSANSFYHQDTILLTNKPYGINAVRAVQTSSDGKENLIVDISAFTTSVLTEIEETETPLQDLRFLKNKVFYSVIKDPISNFGGIADV